jgi:hypothetical protein
MIDDGHIETIYHLKDSSELRRIYYRRPIKKGFTFTIIQELYQQNEIIKFTLKNAKLNERLG